MKIGYARVSTHDQNLDLQIDALEKAGYTYIVGARLKNLTAALQDKVTDSTRYTQLCENMRTQTIELSKEEDEKKKFLIVSHSQKRAFKDSHDRAKAIESLRASGARKMGWIARCYYKLNNV